MPIYHIFKNNMVVYLDGKSYTISRDDKRFAVIKSLIDEQALEMIGAVIEPHSAFYRAKKRILEAIGVLAK